MTAPTELSVPFGHRLRPAAPHDLTRLVVADPGLAGWLEETGTGTAVYLLVDNDETAVLGGVRIAPGGSAWRIAEECRGTDLAAAFDELVPRWLASHWPDGVRP